MAVWLEKRAKKVQEFQRRLVGGEPTTLRLVSFSVRKRKPDADVTLDVRFVPHPFIRRDGRDPDVQAAVARTQEFASVLAAAQYKLRYSEDVLTLAYGDFLGVLRAVAVVELLAKRLRRPGLRIEVRHLDL